MRSFSRSARLVSSRRISCSSFSNRSYSSGSNNNKDPDSEFSALYRSLSESLKSGKTPSFTEMMSALKGNTELATRLSNFGSQFSEALSSLSTNSSAPARIAVTGAAGELLGQRRPIILSCLEIEKALPAMEGVKMELKDCAFPLLKDVIVTDSAEKAFEGAEFVFLVGAFPRAKGMERADLLKKNAGIFSVQGKALNKTANREKVKTLVVGNPANTNCLIAAYNAPDISPTQFSAMTRLDHNRGISQLADRTGAAVEEISQFAIWGNHSDSQFPDINNTLIKGQNARELINDNNWVSSKFIPDVAKRGAAIIAARGVSSAASAANAAIDQMKDWELGSNGKWVSMGVWTGDKGEKAPYGEQGVGTELFYSYPVICSGGSYKIVEGLKVDADSQKRMQATNAELEKERSDAGLGHRK